MSLNDSVLPENVLNEEEQALNSLIPEKSKGNTVFAQLDFPLHYKNKRYVPPIKFVENQNNLGNTIVTHGMTLYRKGKCLGANSLLAGSK
jgi:hypothetical protein